MKHAIAVFLSFTFWVHAASAAEKCTQIVYSTNPYYPPYHWVNPSGELEGASIDLLQRVAPRGVHLVEVVYPWKRVMHLAEKGEIDLLLSLRVTPEREKYLLFSKQRAFPNPIVAFVRNDLPIEFRSWADLKPFYGAISAGDTFGAGFDEYLRSDLRFEEGYTLVENFRKLEARRVDYYVSGQYLGDAYLARTGRTRLIKALMPPLSTGGIHFAFSRKSPCAVYLDEINERLRKMEETDESERLLNLHLARFSRGEVGDVFLPP